MKKTKILALLMSMAMLTSAAMPGTLAIESAVDGGTPEYVCGVDYEHTHEESCYDAEVVCGLEVTEGHTHGDECYAVETTTCELTEEPHECTDECEESCEITVEHVHGDDCATEEVETLICEQGETEGHAHSEGCYGEAVLSCTTAEHTHDETCLPEPEVCEYCEQEVCICCDFCEGTTEQHDDTCITYCTCEPVEGVHQDGCVFYAEYCEKCYNIAEECTCCADCGATETEVHLNTCPNYVQGTSAEYLALCESVVTEAQSILDSLILLENPEVTEDGEIVIYDFTAESLLERVNAIWGQFETAETDGTVTETELDMVFAALEEREIDLWDIEERLNALIEGEYTDEIVSENVTVSGNIPSEVVVEVTDYSDMTTFEMTEDARPAFVLDITLYRDEAIWQPEEAVSVTIDVSRYGIADGERLRIEHEHENEYGEYEISTLGEYEVIDGTVTFETTGFSVFYGYTVDFEYDGTWYSIEGGSGIYLSQLFIMLGIDRSANDVVSVDFTDTSLLTAVRESRDIEVGGGYDWHLQSLQAFDTEETLTITFGDGEVIVINVYDAQTITSLSTSGNWSTDAQLGADIDITLTGDINMTKQIAVPADYTLTIDGADKYSIKLNADGITMFDVKGTLILKNVVLDGGTVWENGTHDKDRTHLHVDRGDIPTGNTGGRFVVVSGENGSLTATNTTFQNLYSTKTPLYLTDNGKMTLTSCTIQDCECNADGGVINATNDGANESAELNIKGSVIQRCAATGDSYGGVIRTSGSSKITITIDSLIMQQCYSIRWGCILWNSRTGTCTITNSTFKDNFSELRGGAISSEAHSLTLTDCTFLNNESGLYGGAIAVFPYTLSNDQSESNVEINVNIENGCKFSGNKAVSGGALAILLYPSDAAKNGTDKTIYDVKTTINLGTNGYIKENKALTKTVNKSDYADNAQEFVEKASTVNGTGNGGGIFIETTHKNYLSTLKLESGLIQANHAEYGAGAYVTNTDVTFGAITVDGNMARSDGGGLYMKQDDAKDNKAVTTVSNGTITNNKAGKNGGGIYQTGNQGECTVSGTGSVSDNTAANGGGIYINSGSLTVSGGVISGNNATGSFTGTTARDADSGVGGGIYVKTGSFTMSGTSVGLHSNTASVAANDAFASGTGTTLVLPDVETMVLAGWSGDGQPEGWFADYMGDDVNYPASVIKDVDGYNTINSGRYNYYDEDKVEVLYETVLKTNPTTYYCLTIGTPHPGYGNLVITKTLTAPAKETQTFIFEVTGTTRKPETAYSLTVTLVIEKGATTAQVLVANIPDGTYTVAEKDAWSWRYDQTSLEFHPKDGDVISDTTFTVAIENPEWVADFKNDRTEEKWLSGDSYCENWWGDTNGIVVKRED